MNNGKYKFCRLLFKLKNAPSIFQEAIDDILREKVGKSGHVYVDDVITFFETIEKDIDWTLKKLYEENRESPL